MAISTEGKIGIALGLVGIGAGGIIGVASGVLITGWICVAFSVWGLILLGAYHFWHERRPALLSAAYPIAGAGFLASAFVATLWVWSLPPAPPVPTPQPVAKAAAADPRAFCFIGFNGYHNQQSMALTAMLHNQNKEAVEFTTMGADFSLDGYPVPPQIEAKHERIFPEEHLLKQDSTLVRLGRDFPVGTKLHGKVDYQFRYGPDNATTVLLRIRGGVTITLGPKRSAKLKWDPAADSLPDCSQEVLAAYDKIRTAD